MLTEVHSPIIDPSKKINIVYKQYEDKLNLKKSPWIQSIGMVDGVWEPCLGEFLYQLDPDTKKVAIKL